jgi:hypothetical protein
VWKWQLLQPKLAVARVLMVSMGTTRRNQPRQLAGPVLHRSVAKPQASSQKKKNHAPILQPTRTVLAPLKPSELPLQ